MKRRSFLAGLAAAIAAAFVPRKTLAQAAPVVNASIPTDYEARQKSYSDLLANGGSLTGPNGIAAHTLDIAGDSSRGNELSANAAIFFEGQTIDIWPCEGGPMRGSRKIIRLKRGTLVLDAPVPAGTRPGDLICLSSVPPIPYFIDSSIGTLKGLARR